jgi:hypothetical protein
MRFFLYISEYSFYERPKEAWERMSSSIHSATLSVFNVEFLGGGLIGVFPLLRLPSGLMGVLPPGPRVFCTSATIWRDTRMRIIGMNDPFFVVGYVFAARDRERMSSSAISDTLSHFNVVCQQGAMIDWRLFGD